MRWGRVILAVIAGAVVWATLWVGGTMALVPQGQPVTHVGALIGLILYSVVLSALAGYVTAAVARAGAVTAVWSLAVLQLILGIIAETSAWSLTPVWYHLVFLALIVPATVAGGRRRSTYYASS
jgi:hypothetical protein